jgi:hypothetical protein
MLAQLVPHMRLTEVREGALSLLEMTRLPLPACTMVQLPSLSSCTESCAIQILATTGSAACCWLPQAPQFTSPHWILGIACPLQQTEAGLDQGAFVALAQQPLQQVRLGGKDHQY